MPSSDPALYWRESGDPAGLPVIFLHDLGLNLQIWAGLIPGLPAQHRYLTCDLRGHGRSPAPPGPWSMGALVRDIEQFLEAEAPGGAVLVGHGLGGMIAQGLAVKRPDLLRGLVLSNTATKLATPATWAARIERLGTGGMEAAAKEMLPRWFPRFALKSAQADLARDMLLDTPVEGYLAACQAISGTDFYATTARLQLPVLVISGSNDGDTPPDLVKETADLVAGAGYVMIRSAGHLPMLDRPGDYAEVLTDFLARIGRKALACGHNHAPGESCGGH